MPGALYTIGTFTIDDIVRLIERRNLDGTGGWKRLRNAAPQRS